MKRSPVGHRAPRARGLLLVLVAALAPPALAQEDTATAPADPGATLQGKRFKDWTVGCQKPDESGTRRCFIAQQLSLKQEDKQVPLLRVVVGRFGAEKRLGALVTMPLGISLPSGVSLQVDEGQKISTPVERCTQQGCVAGFKLTDELVASLKAGQHAKVGFRDGARRDVVVPVSLSGFTAAFDALP